MASLNDVAHPHPEVGAWSVGGVPMVWLPFRLVVQLEALVVDVAGPAEGAAWLQDAAWAAACDVVRSGGDALGAPGGAQRFPWSLQMARLFGEGRMRLETVEGRRRGVVEGPFSSLCRLLDPLGLPALEVPPDLYAAGWMAAGIEVGLGRPPGTIRLRQTGRPSSVGEPAVFELERGAGQARAVGLELAALGLPAGGADAGLEARMSALQACPAAGSGLVVWSGVPVVLRPVRWLMTLQQRGLVHVAGDVVRRGVWLQALAELWRQVALTWLCLTEGEPPGAEGAGSPAWQRAASLSGALGLGRPGWQHSGAAGTAAGLTGWLPAHWEAVQGLAGEGSAAMLGGWLQAARDVDEATGSGVPAWDGALLPSLLATSSTSVWWTHAEGWVGAGPPEAAPDAVGHSGAAGS
jgi:hypothetical protein